MDESPRRLPTVLNNDPSIYRQMVAEFGRPGVERGPDAGTALDVGTHRSA